jgi:hypothetical protein
MSEFKLRLFNPFTVHFIAGLQFICFALSGQEDSVSVWKTPPEINLALFADVYYCYDFNRPVTSYRQPQFVNFNRHNEFNLNLGFIEAGVSHVRYRANLALQAGTYAVDNYSKESAALKNIYEARAGLSLNKKSNLWLDVGIFTSHVGFESPLSINQLSLTRSLLAENVPYYLNGAVLSYRVNEHWEMSGIVCNGWQRIQRVEGNSLLSFGSQLVYQQKNRLKINWSTLMGTDDPDMIRRMRYFSNLYGIIELWNRWTVIAGFDIGIQQESKGSTEYQIWTGQIISASYRIHKNWSATCRAEYYNDPNSIIVTSANSEGFQTGGLSVNLDYRPAAAFLARIEARWLKSVENAFNTTNGLSDQNFFITTSLVVYFKNAIKDKSVQL